MAEERKSILPHVLLFPFPIQGHMPPMLKLAQLLLSSAAADLLITFVNTEHGHRRFARHSPVLLQLLERQSNFRFRTIPDGLPEDDPRPYQQFMQLEESLRINSREHYRKLLVPSASDGWPPVTCVVADAILALAIEIAEEEGIPVMVFRTSSACSFWVFRCADELVLKGELPLPENADLDELVRGVEGTESFLRRRDLPSFCRDVKSPGDPRLQILSRVSDNASRARALIINTFQALEAPMLSRVRTFCPTIYSIGPIHVLARNSSQASLWQEDRKCMAWLDEQQPKSVVYVSFGSIALMSREEMIELWHGLLNSGHRFLWVVREDLVPEELGASSTTVLELEKRSRDAGCMVSWAPQEEVLAHPAVGCFLTHGGWNSTMESIAAGVPMVCWPFMTDQQVNSRFVSEVWKVGFDMKDEGGRGVVEKMVRDVMEGEEKGEEVRRAVGEMAAEARASVDEGGSSWLNFQDLIQHIKSLSSNKSTQATSIVQF